MSGHPGIGPTSDHQYRTRCPDLRPPRRHRCPYGLTRLWAGNRSLPDRLLASQRISLRSIHFASMDKGLVATSPSSDGVKSISQMLPDAFEGSTNLSETVSRLHGRRSPKRPGNHQGARQQDRRLAANHRCCASWDLHAAAAHYCSVSVHCIDVADVHKLSCGFIYVNFPQVCHAPRSGGRVFIKTFASSDCRDSASAAAHSAGHSSSCPSPRTGGDQG